MYPEASAEMEKISSTNLEFPNYKANKDKSNPNVD
jgi:hypothetical protein